MSLVLNRIVAGYEALPDWPKVQPDPSVRRLAATMEAPGYMNDRTGFGSDSAYAKSRQGQDSSAAGGQGRYDGQAGAYRGAETLDKFLESSDEETSSDEEDDSEEETSDEEETSEEGEEETSEEESGSGQEDNDDEEEEDEEEASSSEEEAILPPKRANGRRG